MSKRIPMLKSKLFLFLQVCFLYVISIMNSQAYADGYLTNSDLENIKYECYLEETKIVFCSEQDISNPQVIIRIPLLEPIILKNSARAYRVMATIENLTKRNLIGARVELIFGTKKQSVEIMISEKIIYRGTSTTNRSHLIRSDVPKNLLLYEALEKIYHNAEISDIKIKLLEVKFADT